jgi:hypothetical protein
MIDGAGLAALASAACADSAFGVSWLTRVPLRSVMALVAARACVLGHSYGSRFLALCSYLWREWQIRVLRHVSCGAVMLSIIDYSEYLSGHVVVLGGS